MGGIGVEGPPRPDFVYEIPNLQKFSEISGTFSM